MTATWVSGDGVAWRAAGRVDVPAQKDPQRLARTLFVEAGGATVRYFRVVARKQLLPDWHAGAGNPAWIFADEIVIEGP